jgi:AcrR family transcriptional regulator
VPARPRPRRRRGRPPDAERQQRQDECLDAALGEIVEHGYEALTVLAVAQRARSSKESIYTWFGSKEGLVAALIRRQAEQTNQAVGRALGADRDPDDALEAVANGLLALLLGPVSLALNRAAMTSPELAALLLLEGRHRTGPLVERYLEELHRTGVLHAPDAADAFRLFYGLVIQDSQIRALLGERPPSTTVRKRQAREAVGRFRRLCAVGEPSFADPSTKPRRPVHNAPPTRPQSPADPG